MEYEFLQNQLNHTTDFGKSRIYLDLIVLFRILYEDLSRNCKGKFERTKTINFKKEI